MQPFLVAEMDKSVILDYLVTKSELARSLESPVTLEELLAHQKDPELCMRLLAALPQLETDRLKVSNCLLDSTLPYDSLIGMSNTDLKRLVELCDYLILPDELSKKLNKVIETNIDIYGYIGCLFDTKETWHWAGIGDLRGLQWAHMQGYNWNKKACMLAAWNGDLECLKYAHKQGCPWDESTCEHAASAGHLNCLRYAHEHGCPWNGHTYINAAKNGHLDCLQYAYMHDCPWPIQREEICMYAAGGGHLDCLKWLHTSGEYPWNEETCSFAAQRGHLDCLQYAHMHGCPWDFSVPLYAMINGYPDCLEYARAHGCPEN